ncbi:MAG: iron-sulfur cluster assembly accessory protein [Rhodospirillaceae bacterium]
MTAPAVMTITEAAAARVKEIMSNRNTPAVGLRIGVKPRGCSGLSYTMDYAEEIKSSEDVVKDKGVTILIDPAATLFLVGTELDYVDDKVQPGFVFRNPNEKARCGCGESFTV